MLEMMAKPYRLRMNLQLFAADGGGEGGQGGEGGGSGGDGGGKGGEGEGKGGGKVTFSPEQQAEVDRILGERLTKAQSKWEKDFQAKLDEAKTEAEKLAKMTAEQKAQHERDKRDKDLADRENGITRRELRATALEQLAEKGLPKVLADVLVYTDADSTNKSIEAVEKAFKDAVEAGVNERLKGEPPRGAGGKGNGGGVGKSFADRANEGNKPTANAPNPWATA
ncbi:DUF4355 domain-containing protein [Cohnella sp. GCM10020058]|uniref:DUF4355 domain-containing protein n=1 Tax=Cohnella sp. GCM10020058 TaxID=3317330 RepID=UPI00362997A1